LTSALSAQQPSSKALIAGLTEAQHVPQILVFVPLNELDEPDVGATPVEVRLAPDGLFTAELAPGKYAVAYHPPCYRVTGFRLVLGTELVKLALAWIPDDMKQVQGGTTTALAARQGSVATSAALPATPLVGMASSGVFGTAARTPLPFDLKLGQAGARLPDLSSSTYMPPVSNFSVYLPTTAALPSMQMTTFTQGLSATNLNSMFNGPWTMLTGAGAFSMPTTVSLYNPPLTTIRNPVTTSSFYPPWTSVTTPAVPTMPAIPTQPPIPTIPAGKGAGGPGGVFLDTRMFCEEQSR
jgi:hypothetical protein